MSEKFLYYVGAGASAQALPIVKDSPDGKTKGLAVAFKEMADHLNFNDELSLKHQEFINNFVKDLNWLASESSNFTTIDTYAKFLYLKDRAKLKTLKLTLSVYFSIEQLVNKKQDKRYINWLTNSPNSLFDDSLSQLAFLFLCNSSIYYIAFHST